MISEKVEIKNTRYYELVNKHYEKALYLTSGSGEF